MLQFSVDRDVCIKCGECAADCPRDIIQMVDGEPEILKDKEHLCLECQHCLAVCKPGALSILGLNPRDSILLKGNMPAPESLEVLMMGRRSVRRYQEEAVAPELIEHILEVVRAAPTGRNIRATHFALVDDPAIMKELRDRTYAGIRRAVDTGTLPDGLEFFKGVADAWDRGTDLVYRDAPHLLVASAPADGPSAVADCLIALTYFELLAAGHGLGTVWNGFAKWALFDVAPEVGDLLGIPQGHVIGYVMAFGKPAVKYHRTVQRPGGTVGRVTL